MPISLAMKSSAKSRYDFLIPLDQDQRLDLLLKLTQLAAHLLHRSRFGLVEAGSDRTPHQLTLALPCPSPNFVELVPIGGNSFGAPTPQAQSCSGGDWFA